MRILYALAGHLINTALYIASWRSPKIKAMLRGRRETATKLRQSLSPNRETIWLHASSLGEFEQGRPLIEAIRNQYPGYQMLLSFFSPSGYEVRKDYSEVDCVVYLPGDTPKEVKAFLDIARPKIAIFIKYDFWPFMLSELKRREVKTYLISAIFREKQQFFKPWGGGYRRLLHYFDHLFVQDGASVALLAKHGVSSVSIAGDTRFDRVESIAQKAVSIPEVEELKKDGSMLIIAGSTWAVDEEMLLQHIEQGGSKTKYVIAPHELHEEQIQAIEHRLGNQVARLSQLREKGQMPTEQICLIIDSFGLLSSLYRYADIAYIGGGFGKSIHNTVEAAVYGIPVVFGPKYHKFREAHLLLQNKGGYAVQNGEELSRCLDHLIHDEETRISMGQAARRLVAEQLGATDKIIKKLNLKQL